MLWTLQLVSAYAMALLHTLGSEPVSPPAVGATSELPRLWAGHQFTLGKRNIPIKGEVTTRMDSFVLAELHQNGDRIELHQTACDVQFAPVGGVQVHMDASRLPVTKVMFATSDEGSMDGASLVAWSKEDVDNDGNPGMTINVDASICSGKLFVTNRSLTRATAQFSATRIEGRAKVHVEQSVLGAEGACLSAVAKDTDERVTGPFAYVPVPAGSTCETLEQQGWPVSAR